MILRHTRFVLVALIYLVSGPPQLPSSRTMTVTIDDLATASVLGNHIGRAEKTSRDLLAAIKRANVPAIGFVNEWKLETSGKEDPRRVGSCSSGSTPGSSLATTVARA